MMHVSSKIRWLCPTLKNLATFLPVPFSPLYEAAYVGVLVYLEINTEKLHLHSAPYRSFSSPLVLQNIFSNEACPARVLYAQFIMICECETG